MRDLLFKRRLKTLIDSASGGNCSPVARLSFHVTTATHVHVHRKAPADLQTDIERVRKLAIALDSQFQIMGFKLGWDAIIGLVPVAGDLVTTIIGVYPII